MPTSGGPGQQAIPKAIRAMPARRDTGTATPVSCSPSNNCPTNEGTISNANPVRPRRWPRRSTRLSSFSATGPLFGALRCFNRVRLRRCHWRQFCPWLRDGLKLRFELERQLVDLAGELERRIVAILQHRDPGAGVLADVERLVLRERDRRAVFHGIPGHFLAVHVEHARPSLAQPRTIRLEVEDNGVLAGAQLWPCPSRAFEVKQVVEEHRLAPT